MHVQHVQFLSYVLVLCTVCLVICILCLVGVICPCVQGLCGPVWLCWVGWGLVCVLFVFASFTPFEFALACYTTLMAVPL